MKRSANKAQVIIPRVIHPANRKKRPEDEVNNRYISEIVEGYFMPNGRHYQNPTLQLQLKPGIGWDFEFWDIPFNVKVAVPRYVQSHVLNEMKVQHYESTSVTSEFGAMGSIPLINPSGISRVHFVSAA